MNKPKPIDHSDRETLVRRRLRDVMGHATSKPAYGRIHNDAAAGQQPQRKPASTSTSAPLASSEVTR